MAITSGIRKLSKRTTKKWPYLILDIQTLFVILSALTSYVLVCYMAAFDHRHRENIGILVGIYLCDAVYLADSIHRFIHLKKLSGHFDTTCKQKARRFIPCALDLISLLPLELFVFIISVHYLEELTYLSVFSFLKVNRVIRLYRIPVFYARKTRELRLNLFTREVFAIIVSFLSFLIILFHGIACIWFRLRCFGVYSNLPPKCHRLGETVSENNTANEIDSNHPYYRHLDNSSGDSWGWYVGGLHWSVMSLRNSGNRFLLPRSPIQMIISILIQLFGLFLGAAILLICIYVVAQLDLRRSIFFHEAGGARSFVKHFNMGKAIIHFLNDSFNFMWHQNRAYTDHNLKPLLPKYIRTQICMCIFEPMVLASELLQCFSTMDLETLSLEVHYKHYFANEFILRPGTLGYNIFYISSGVVEIMSEEDPSIAILTLAKGSLIAELNGIFPTLRRNGVKTRSPCDILRLNYQKIIEIARHDMDTLRKMTKILTDRMFWIALQIEAKLKKEEAMRDRAASEVVENGLEPPQTVNEGQLAGPDFDDLSQKDAMEAHFQHRRFTIAHNIKNWRKRSEVERTYFTGAQFMSVLAWVKFYKDKKRSDRKKDAKFGYVFVEMHKNFRNPASNGLKVSDIERIFSQELNTHSGQNFYLINLPFVIANLLTALTHDIQSEFRPRWGTLPPKYVCDRLIISKSTFPYTLWDSFVLSVIIFYSLIFPYELVVATSKFCTGINAYVEIVYYLDVVLRLFIFYDPTEMSPLTTVLAHVFHEFRNIDIIFDIVAILPIHHIAYLKTDTYKEYLYFRLHMIVFKFIKLLKRFREWENDVTTHQTLIRICKHAIFISVYIFWLASVFCSFGCPHYPDCKRKPENETTWVDKFFTIESAFQAKPNPNRSHTQDNFTYAFPLSLYWAVCVTFGIGFTENINPSTRRETSWQTIGLLFGFVMCTYFCADLASSLAGSSENKSHHQDKTIWLDHYLDDALIELKLIARVNHYLSVQWQILRGISADTTQAIGFLSVYHTMYTELVVHIVAESLFRTYYFQNMDTDLARKFCLAAKIVVVPPNEVVILEGDLIRRMYIIRRGYVEVYFGDSNLKLDVLTSGQSFGEVNMIFGVPSKVTVRTLTYTEIIIIDQSAFESFLPTSKLHAEEFTKLLQRPEALEKFQASLEIPDTPEIQQVKRKYRLPSISQPQVHLYRRKRRKGESTPHFEEAYIKGYKKKVWIRFFLLPLTFLPTGCALRVWEAIRLLAAAGIVFFVPLIEAYPLAKEKYKSYIYILDSVTFLDMIIRTHVAYYDSKTNELITHPLLAAKNYLRSGFLADLIGSLPVYLIIDTAFKASPINESIPAYLFRLNRLILVYRLYGFCIYQNSKILNRRTLWRILELIPIFFFHVHIMACVASVLACPSSTIEAQILHPRCYPDTWITRGKHPEITSSNETLTSFQIYAFSFYYVATTSVGCGFADFRPASEIERTYAALVFFCDIFILTYFLASMAGSKSHKDYKSLRYQQHMNYLVGYLGREKLESRLTSRIIRYYDYQWLRTKGIEPQKLFSNLLPSLRKEVSIFVFEDVINQIPILKDVPYGFLRSLCVSLTPVYFLRHDIIVRREDICDIIYFIFRGRVAITNVSNDEAQLDEGGIIGVLDPEAYNPVYEVMATAITNVDMFTMRRKDFGRVLKGYPDVANRFMNREDADEPTEIRVPKESYAYPSESWRRHTSASAVDRQSGGLSFSGSSGSSFNSGAVVEILKEAEDNVSGESEAAEDMRQTLSEVVALVIEEEKQEESKYEEEELYAKSILPESRVFKILNISIFLAASLSTSLAAYQWGFKNFFWPYFLVGYICDVVYIVKMGLSFRVSFVDEMGDIVTDFTEIENKYISDPLGFALDFLSTFPLEVFAFSIVRSAEPESFAKGNLLWTGFRLNRLLRLIHLWLYYAKRSDGFIVNLVRLKLARLAVLTAIYFHFCTCILHGFTGFRSYKRVCICDEKHNFCRPNSTGWKVPETWFHTKAFDEGEPSHSFCSPYVMTMYFIITTFTTTAYGDIYAVTAFEMFFISFVAVSSKVWLGLVLSDILSGIQNNTNLSYHLAADGVLKLYSDYGVSKDILTKAIKYFTFGWVQNKGIIFPDFLSRAPACLRMDICASIYGDHFRKSYLFRDLSESFIRHASIRLHHEWVLESDFVIRQKEVDDKLYFIHRGIVEYSKEIPGVGEDGQTTLNKGFLTKSRHFGEANGILGVQAHEYSYIADTNVDIVSLSHADIEELFELFPQHRLKILRRFYGKHSTMYHSPSFFENVRYAQTRHRGSLKLTNFDE